MSFVITKDWLESHGTRGCGFTARQLKIVGVPWPPPYKWKRRLVGTTITDEARQAFEGSNPKAAIGFQVASHPTTGYMAAIRCRPWQKRCDRCEGTLMRPFYWTRNPDAEYRTICESCHDEKMKHDGIAPWPKTHRTPDRWVGPPCWATSPTPRLVKVVQSPTSLITTRGMTETQLFRATLHFPLDNRHS